jgi:hypothetical protein
VVAAAGGLVAAGAVVGALVGFAAGGEVGAGVAADWQAASKRVRAASRRTRAGMLKG